jgi:hypothetical protein
MSAITISALVECEELNQAQKEKPSNDTSAFGDYGEFTLVG